MLKTVVFEVPRTCVLTIQGGGALAAELIGQLKGVTGARNTRQGPTKDHEMDVVGLAGASAGSIIAALFWAGYDPDEILRHTQDIFSQAGRERFFGPYDPSQIPSYAAFERFLARLTAAWSPGWAPASRPWLLPGLRLLLAKTVLLLTLVRRLPRIFARNGIFEATGFVETIDRLLRQSPNLLAHLPAGGADGTGDKLLTFGDLRGRPGLDLVPLFLMVTDVGGQRLKLVSSIDDGLLDMPIALAVRASAGFPYFFRPASLPGAECCIDGGVISNLPTWVFDKEFRQRLRQAETANPAEDALLHRIARLPWHHVALRLPPGDAAHERRQVQLHGWRFLAKLVALLTGVGRQQLEGTLSSMVAAKRFVVQRPAPADDPDPPNPAEMISGVLQFGDLTDTRKVNATFRVGRLCAQRAIDEARFRMPDATRFLPLLRDFESQATAALAPYLRPGFAVRTNIFLPATSEQLRIFAAWNMAGHADEAIQLEEGRAVTSLCFIYGEPFLANLQDQTITPEPGPGFDPFAAKASPERSWLMSLPILDPLDTYPRPLGDQDNGALVLGSFGPIFGVLNVDASIVYEPPEAPAEAPAGAPVAAPAGTAAETPPGLPAHPVDQLAHPAVRAVFSAGQATAERAGLLINDTWLSHGATKGTTDV